MLPSLAVWAAWQMVQLPKNSISDFNPAKPPPNTTTTSTKWVLQSFLELNGEMKEREYVDAFYKTEFKY